MNKKLLFIVLILTGGLHAAQGDAPPPAQPLMTKVEGGWRCDSCGKGFKGKSEVERHIRVHNGERPYQCSHPGCAKAFKRNDHLKTHQRTHTGERPFVCSHPGCILDFSQQSILQRHERIHTDERPFVCSHPGCGRNFSDSTTLKKHKLTHSDERPYQCSLCGEAFKRKDYLTGHLQSRVHRNPPLPIPLDAPVLGINPLDKATAMPFLPPTPAPLTPAPAASAPAPGMNYSSDDDDPDVWTEE